MISTFHATFAAKSHEEAIEKATSLWREYRGDPTAELPWDATMRIDYDVESTVSRDAAGHTTIIETEGLPVGQVALSAKFTEKKE